MKIEPRQVDEMRALIRQSIMPPDASDTDLYYLLEMAATYQLDPFAREIWAVNMPGRNGARGRPGAAFSWDWRPSSRSPRSSRA